MSNRLKRDRETVEIIADIQKAEDQVMADRRKRLSGGFKRALPHLQSSEIETIEHVLWKAIGRSIVLGD